MKNFIMLLFIHFFYVFLIPILAIDSKDISETVIKGDSLSTGCCYKNLVVLVLILNSGVDLDVSAIEICNLLMYHVEIMFVFPKGMLRDKSGNRPGIIRE